MLKLIMSVKAGETRMSNHVIKDEATLRAFLSSKNFVDSPDDHKFIDDFIKDAVFQEEKLTGMRYDNLMIKFSINEFLEFLDAAGIDRRNFTEPALAGTGCGKNYKGPKGSCESSLGNYCDCKDGI